MLLWKHKSAKNTKRSLSLFHRLKGGFNKPAWLSKCFSALCWKGRTRISVQSWWDGAEIRSAMRCGWIYCKHVTELTNDTKEHVSSSHTIPSSFVFPDSNDECACEFCGITFFMGHNFAMNLNNNHNIGFECDHCHEYLPGGEGGFIEIHMKLCPAPCDGDPKCACKWWCLPP